MLYFMQMNPISLEPQNTARLEHPVPQPITVEQYELLSEHGLLPENVELIRGVIVAMPPMGDEHVNALDELFKRCLFKFSNRARKPRLANPNPMSCSANPILEG
jgi:hypothetical protein